METHLKMCENERPTTKGFDSEEMEIIEDMWNGDGEERLTLEEINSIYDLTLF